MLSYINDEVYKKAYNNRMSVIRTYLFDIECSFGWCLHEYESIFFGESFPFLSWYLSSVLQVALVTDEHDNHVRVSILSHLFEPSSQVIESVSPIYSTLMLWLYSYLVMSYTNNAPAAPL